MNSGLIDLIIEKMGALNQEISKDVLLGENYRVGHSFFCPKGNNFSGLDSRWFEGIIQTEIIPLLKEYWFDNSSRVEKAITGLLSK